MVKIGSRLGRGNRIRLGESCEFDIVGVEHGIETRAFLKHRDILYLKPLADWSTAAAIRVHPEAPGEYTLIVQWRNSDGETGQEEEPFKVGDASLTTYCPTKIKAYNGIRMWVTTEWESGAQLSYEQSAIDLLVDALQPGWVVYDIGANMGFYSIVSSRAVGKHGRVYCFEANPVCVHFLRANLEMNRVRNAEILPVAVSDSNKPIDFAVNYGNSSLGIAKQSAFYSAKMGHEVTVHGRSLDELSACHNLTKPDVIKLDIEGAEDYALAGMEAIISECSPIILVEVHGRPVAERTFRRLGRAAYRYRDARSGKEFSCADDLMAWFPDEVLQIMCYPTRDA